MKERLDNYLKRAFELGASDIHLTVGVTPMMRLHGKLEPIGEETLLPRDTEEMARVLVPEFLWDTFEERGEIDFSYSIQGVSRFRVNAYHQRSCVCIAIRVIPQKIPTFEELQLPPVLKSVIQKHQGLILVTGPTGSGKSTTLAAMIDEMNRTVQRHIVTLEDPIEYLHRHQRCIINQREVGFDTKSFANGLRACLRQDPDVILVGEMRDLETISTAITAAETGHLVLATLHTSDAPTTIDRIIDVFPGEQQGQVRIQLASVLQAIISQRLFPLKNGSGRVAAFEVLISNPAIRNLIRNEKIHQIHSIMQTSRAAGMQTLTMSVQQLVHEGKISTEVALPYISEGMK